MRVATVIALLLCFFYPAAADDLCRKAPFRFEDKGDFSVATQNMMNFLFSRWGSVPDDRLRSLVERNANPGTWSDEYKRNELISDQFYYRFALMEKEVSVLNRARKILSERNIKNYIEQIVELIVELNELHSSMETFYRKSVFRIKESSGQDFEIQSSIMIRKTSADALMIFRCNFRSIK